MPVSTWPVLGGSGAARRAFLRQAEAAAAKAAKSGAKTARRLGGRRLAWPERLSGAGITRTILAGNVPALDRRAPMSQDAPPCIFLLTFFENNLIYESHRDLRIANLMSRENQSMKYATKKAAKKTAKKAPAKKTAKKK
jgi:hypothetical protein